ncbi:uncharacterized protein METZ01_LOCUS506899 [marine metagenome]|uniref:Uncharacterized protein n=1 Tax=marine metagenome TaxID=408172 RepID=A0A383ECG9_9ZZZZ
MTGQSGAKESEVGPTILVRPYSFALLNLPEIRQIG